MKSAATGQRLRGGSPYCATSTDSQLATGVNKHHERRPPQLMGGASANHAPAVTPIITEDSNPLSDRARHLPSPSLQAQVTITREDHTGLWAEQAPTMLHQSSLKTQTFCPTMQPSCVLATDTTISPLLQSQAQECKYHPYPLKTRTFHQAVQSSPYLTKPRISPFLSNYKHSRIYISPLPPKRGRGCM